MGINIYKLISNDKKINQKQSLHQNIFFKRSKINELLITKKICYCFRLKILNLVST